MEGMRLGDIDGLRAYMKTQGIDDGCIDPLKNYAVVEFSLDSKGCVHGFANGRKVYREKESESTISAGQTWFCRIKENPRAYNQGFAVAVLRIDTPEFAMSISSKQYDIIAEKVFENDRDGVLGRIWTNYADVIAEMIREEAEKLKSESEERISDAETENGLLRNELEAVREELESVRKEAAGMADIADCYAECFDSYDEEVQDELSALRARIEQLTSENIHLRSELDLAKNTPAVQIVKTQTQEPVRIDADSLYCPGLADGRYCIRVSADGKKATLRPDIKGTAVCTAGTVVVSGLGGISPFAVASRIGFTAREDGSAMISL